MREESIESEIYMRGSVIKTAVGIEALLVTIILHCSMHLNTQKKEAEEFKIKRLGFGDVVTKSRKLLKKYHPDLHKQYRSLFSRIQKVVSFRNWFAHCPIIWKDREKGIFDIQDTKIDANGFEYNHLTNYSRNETMIFLDSIYKDVIPPLKDLSTDVKERFSASHPDLFAMVMQAYNEIK